mmetsp:Transcript_17911/g.12890  ORF Transcript_17911/g.12890 Transcript_17911/m.12890 type:complete len:121 (+) Transcript_17911:3090-3452(+)
MEVDEEAVKNRLEEEKIERKGKKHKKLFDKEKEAHYDYGEEDYDEEADDYGNEYGNEYDDEDDEARHNNAFNQQNAFGFNVFAKKKAARSAPTGMFYLNGNADKSKDSDESSSDENNDED